jgi:hypothetical protein
MDITCTRCHRTLLAEECYCPVCGLPQLTYSAADDAPVQEQQERWTGAVRDAGSIAWKPALRWALLLAVPAGLLSSEASPLGGLGMVWMAAAAAWAVALYVRQQRAAWITLGAGARIGLVTGLLAGWLSFGASSCALFFQRVVLHQSSEIDGQYTKIFVESFQQKAQQSIAGMGSADVSQAQAVFAKMLAGIMSPEGHGAMWTGALTVSSLFLLLFAIVGGAVGARLMGRRRTTEL